jgi:hypothetical protein
MMAIRAELVMQFDASLTLGIIAVAIAIIPSTSAPCMFAHAELALAVVLNADH